MEEYIKRIKELQDIISQHNKKDWVDILTAIRYIAQNDIGQEIIDTFDLEFLMSIIYQTEQRDNRPLNLETIKKVIEKIEEIEAETILEQKNREIYQYSFTEFRFNKENKYLNQIIKQLKDLYTPYDTFFEERYGVTIDEYIFFIELVVEIYNNRIDKIKSVLGEKISLEKLVEYILENNIKIFHFKEETIGANTYTKNKINKIFNYFSQNIEETIKLDKIYILNDIPFIEKPIVKLENSYIIPSIYTILKNSQYLFEKDILNSEISIKYAYSKGKYLGNEIANIFNKCMKNAETLKSAKYTYQGKERETDVIVVFDNNVIIVEAKSCALKEVSKRGNLEKLKEDYEQNIIEAFEQCCIAEQYIKNTPNAEFKSEEGKLIILDQKEINIYKLNITLEEFGILASHYSKIDKKLPKDMISMSLNDLIIITELLEYQTEMVDYLHKRIICNKYMEEYNLVDEQYLFVEYKVFNLESIFNKKHPEINIFDIGRRRIYDEYYKNNNKTQALKKWIEPNIHNIILQLEEKNQYGFSKVVRSLLELDHILQKKSVEGLKEARKTKKEREDSIVYYYIKVEETIDLPSMTFLLYESTRKEIEISVKGFIGQTIEAKKKNPKDKVIGLMNYIEDEEYIISMWTYL